MSSVRGAQRLTRVALAGAALSSPALLVVSCVGVLELDSYDSAIEVLCKCDSVVPQFDGKCVQTLGDRLDRASGPRRKDWLANFASNCGGSCDNAYQCYQQVGTCAAVSCSADNECCDYVEGGTVRCDESGECAG